jgi:dTDP-4-amino-4,6-dideoxygalactose transaminase
MIEVCAAMGLAGLDSQADTVAANTRNHAAYVSALDGIAGISVLKYDDREQNSHHYVVIEVADEFPATRDDIVAALQAENILARKYFWPGCHGMQPYRDLFPHARLMLPNTEDVSRRVVVLPNGPGLPDECISTVAAICHVMKESVA